MVRNQTVITIEENGYYDLQTKVKAKKKKHLVNGEGSNQMNLMKKNASKLKSKGCTNLPIVIESSSEEADEKPKKLKRKGTQRFYCDQDGDCEISSKEVPAEQQEALFFISKKPRRDIPDSDGVGDGFPAKKKKKKKKHKPGHGAIQLSGENGDEPVKHISKKQKNISQNTVFYDEKKIQPLVQDAAGDRNIVKKKKVCCLKGKGTVYQLEEFGWKRRALGFQQHLEDSADVSEEESKVRKKKRKKKNRKQPLLASEDNQEKQSGVSIESQPKQKSKRKPSDGKEKIGLISDSEQDSKVKKKKKKKKKKKNKRKTQTEVDQPTPLEDDGDVATNESWSATKRTKNTPKSKRAQDHVSWQDRSENDSMQHIKKKKKKSRENRGFNACGEEPSFKKAKIKQETKEGDEEIKVVAFKKGNCDEIQIDKLRRQALQEEIDRESGKMKTVKEEGESDAHFGQWSTATFENSEQKTKFLRLLGGFKKGSVPAQGPPAHASKLNMALDKSKEQNLQQNLQTEFEKALAWKQHRGIGLGFQPPVQKQMHIDKFASRSIKFED